MKRLANLFGRERTRCAVPAASRSVSKNIICAHPAEWDVVAGKRTHLVLLTPARNLAARLLGEVHNPARSPSRGPTTELPTLPASTDGRRTNASRRLIPQPKRLKFPSLTVHIVRQRAGRLRWAPDVSGPDTARRAVTMRHRGQCDGHCEYSAGYIHHRQETGVWLGRPNPDRKTDGWTACCTELEVTGSDF